jgi:hypothetical protein
MIWRTSQKTLAKVLSGTALIAGVFSGQQSCWAGGEVVTRENTQEPVRMAAKQYLYLLSHMAFRDGPAFREMLGLRLRYDELVEKMRPMKRQAMADPRVAAALQEAELSTEAFSAKLEKHPGYVKVKKQEDEMQAMWILGVGTDEGPKTVDLQAGIKKLVREDPELKRANQTKQSAWAAYHAAYRAALDDNPEYVKPSRKLLVIEKTIVRCWQDIQDGIVEGDDALGLGLGVP